MSVPLHVLYSRTLSYAAKAYKLPTIEDTTQDLIQSCLKDLNVLWSRIVALSLFSQNETLEDISTRDLIYISVPYVSSEVEGRVRTTEMEQRLVSLEKCQKYLTTFLDYLDTYNIVPEDERKLYDRKSSSVANPTGRRELKIMQYQKEKDLRARIETIRKRRDQLALKDDSPSDFDLISSLLPSSLSEDDEDEDDSDTDHALRDAILLLLRLFFAQAHSQLESMGQELQLLRTAPRPMAHSPHPDDNDDRRIKQKESERDMWKLDVPSGSAGGSKGPLLDSSGKPLRPFTILPAGAQDRVRLQAQVFGPDHRLPSMTVDEYLEIERQRGNILTGGGPASEKEPTSSERLALAAEMDGTLEAEQKEEEKRQKDENWARYTDENPKGIGNTMNRG